MRSRSELMDAYLLSHRHPTNSTIHSICVPPIVFSTLALAWLVPIGHWIGLEGPLADAVNLATLASLPIGIYYLMLSVGSFITMSVWFALCAAGILAFQAAAWPLLPIAAVMWVVSWALQIYGHKLEGAKPSAADDAVFFLIGPLFVTDKWMKRL